MGGLGHVIFVNVSEAREIAKDAMIEGVKIHLESKARTGLYLGSKDFQNHYTKPTTLVQHRHKPDFPKVAHNSQMRFLNSVLQHMLDKNGGNLEALQTKTSYISSHVDVGKVVFDTWLVPNFAKIRLECLNVSTC
jgi:hypothetical protein